MEKNLMGRLLAWILFLTANAIVMSGVSSIVCGHIQPAVDPLKLLEFSSHEMIFWAILHVTVMIAGFILIGLQKLQQKSPYKCDPSPAWWLTKYETLLSCLWGGAFIDIAFSGYRSVEFANGQWWLSKSRAMPRERIMQSEAVQHLWSNLRFAGGFITCTTIFLVFLILATTHQRLTASTSVKA